MNISFTKQLLSALLKKLLPEKPKAAWVSCRVYNGEKPGRRPLVEV
ncbi:hypothetical protein [Mucilaginibacter sp.]|jgi:hypothetical protein|nr:hypothetical protein [Mucilaginibacter sp.]HTI57752.1 hypothetical protein [Mucilaginibacter sp.]